MSQDLSPDDRRSADPRWQRTRAALIEGGRRIMAAKGVEAATVLEIVRAAGVSQPSFYNHFASKEELAQAVAEDFFRADAAFKIRMFRQLRDPAQAIAINVRHTLEVAMNDPVVAWVLVRSGLAGQPGGAADELVRMIRSGIRQRRFCNTDAAVAAAAIRGAAQAVLREMLEGRVAAEAPIRLAALLLRLLGLKAAEADELARAEVPALRPDRSAA
jgi:AcrR family transcriptional regulator